VLGREALTDRCYWEVEREGKVFIGVTYRGITRRGVGVDSQLGGNNKSWSLYCNDDRYSARYDGIQTALPLPPAGSTRVGVYLDRPAGSLSFYRVSPGGGGSSDTLTHIHTFQASFTQEDLLPGFGLACGCSVSLCQRCVFGVWVLLTQTRFEATRRKTATGLRSKVLLRRTREDSGSHTIGCSSTIVQPPVQSGSCLLANQSHQALITCTCLASIEKRHCLPVCWGVMLLPFVLEMP
ncbi:unnamed protein product, partial [Boreogadus saida]